MPTRLIPSDQTFLDGDGRPLNGGKLYFYEKGTSTPKNTYSDTAQQTANDNPVVLNSAGRADVDIWGSGEFKLIVKDANDGDPRTYNPVLGYDLTGVPATQTTAALKAIPKPGLENGDFRFRQGNTAIDDGGSDFFYYDADSTAVQDNKFVYETDEGGSGRWISSMFKRNVDSLAELAAIPKSVLSDGDSFLVQNTSVSGDGAAYYFWDSSSAVTADGKIFVASGEGGNGRWVKQRNLIVTALDFGARGNNSADDTAAIQAAADYANSVQGLAVVDLMGLKYQTTDEINVATKVILRNGFVQLTTSTPNKAVLSMGLQNGTGEVVRPAGFENLYVKTSSTVTGLTGFRMDGFVRSSWIKDCYAEMIGDVAGTRDHVGFEIAAERITVTSAAGGSSGAYQNVIDNCTALFANTGFKAYTRGTAAEAYGDPQANGNVIRGNAFSCRQKAIWLDNGSQENEFYIRADTFPDQTGLGTTIEVARIDGRFNRGVVYEEIGPRGDTQYTLSFGANSIFNDVTYHTQNVVTAKVNDSSTDTHKNIARQLGTGPFQGPEGGDVVTIPFFADAVATSSTETIMTWVAPEKCVITKAIAKMHTAITNGAAQVYIAKNGVTSDDNRLYFDSGVGTDTVSETALVTAGTAIDAHWLLDEGDTIEIIVNNTSASETKTVKGSVFILFNGV